jgi:hypothetical protein
MVKYLILRQVSELRRNAAITGKSAAPELRIWGLGVRLLSGAPIYSNSYVV